MNNETTITLKFLEEKSPRSATNNEIGAEIMRLCGENLSGQEVREVIHNLRVTGHPVCANSYGYFIGNRSQVMRFIEEFERRVSSQHKAIEGMRKGLNNKLFTDSVRENETLGI